MKVNRTPFGQFMRKIRVDENETIKDMANKLSCSGTYLSFVEIGKRKIPSNWIDIIPEIYKLSKKDTIKLQEIWLDAKAKENISLNNLLNLKRLIIGFNSIDSRYRCKKISISEFKYIINDSFYNDGNDEERYSLQNFIFTFINLSRTYLLYRNIEEPEEMVNLKNDFCYDLITDYKHKYITNKIFELLNGIYQVFGTKLSMDIYNKRYINIIELIIDFISNIFKLNDEDGMKLAEILNYLYELNIDSYKKDKRKDE